MEYLSEDSIDSDSKGRIVSPSTSTSSDNLHNDSLNSIIENSIITEEIIKEEKRLATISSKKSKQLFQIKKADDDEAEANKQQELCYKRLMHLLSKSKFYTNYLMEKLNESGKEITKKTSNQTKTGNASNAADKDKDKSTTTTANSRAVLSENASNQQNAKKRKRADATSQGSDKKKRKGLENFAMSGILTKEALEQAHLEHVKQEQAEAEAGGAKQEPEVGGEAEETVVTSLGFKVPKSQPSLLIGGAMRDYQLKGLEWLKVLYENGVSGILADEMGLGKTIQVIGLLCHLIEANVPGPFLIVAPLSTLSNWLQEFEQFAPQVPVVLFHGSAEQRRALYSKLVRRVQVNERLSAVLPVVVTSYEVPLKETRVMQDIQWQYIIVDEGHRIKNKNSLLSRTLRSLNSKNRLLLTGTPLQNNLTELWALLNFLLPEMFDDLTTFNTWLDLNNLDTNDQAQKIIQKEKEKQLISTLHQILFPFLLRRTKKDVVLNLPPKKEILVYCPMTDLQMELYKFILDQSLAKSLPKVEKDLPRKRTPIRSYKHLFASDLQFEKDIDEAEESTQSESLASKTTKTATCFFDLAQLPVCKQFTDKLEEDGGVEFVERIKMQMPPISMAHIVNHPYLVRMPVQKNAKTNQKTLYVNEDLKNVSGKLLVLDGLLAKLKQKGHKVLVFSTSFMLLDLIEEYMALAQHTYVRLDGCSKLLDRKDDIHAFNFDPDIFAFLISTRAGGLGINLTAADTVIIFNSDWNPMVDLQAQDRAHRIGQKNPVLVLRLTVAGTIDERIIECGQRKRRLEKIVMKNGAFKLDEQKMMDLEELAMLLNTRLENKTVHSNSCGLSDQELEDLLDRSDMIEK